MSDLNVDDFCKDAAKALHILYRNFPQKMTLYVEDICGPDTPDEFGLHSPRFVAAFHALLWLAESDYLRFSQTVKQEAIEEATLSHRAFVFLSTPETSFAENNTNTSRIDVIRDTLRNKSSDQLKALMLNYMEASRRYQ